MNYGELREIALKHIESTPKGATWAEIRDSLGVKSNGCSVAVRLCRAGLAGYVDEPVTGVRGRSRVRRYYARKHCPPEAILLPLSCKAVRPVRHVQKNVTTNKPRRVLSPTGDAITPAGVKVTVWQPPPAAPMLAPLFGPIKVGKAPEPRPWATHYVESRTSQWGGL